MAEASPANGLDLEQLLTDVRKGKLAPQQLAQFETLARATGERLTAYKGAMETYLGYTPNPKDFTFVRRMHGQAVERALTSEQGVLAAYDALLQFGEQHPEGASGYAIFELLKSYAKYTAKLTEGFYPESFGSSLVTGTGEIDTGEAGRRVQRKGFFGMLAQNILDPGKVDYKLRNLLGTNFERWKALEEKIAQGGYGELQDAPAQGIAAVTVHAVTVPDGAMPMQEEGVIVPAVSATPPQSSGTGQAQVYTILYDAKAKPEELIGLEQFARRLWDIAGADEKDRYGGPGLVGFRQFAVVTGGKIAEYCRAKGKESVDCTVTVDINSKKAKVSLR